MKKKLLITVIFVSILFLTGCNGTVTRELRSDGFNLATDKVVCSSLIPKKEGQIVGNKIRYMNENFAVTEDGYIYEMSFSKKYSNNENCKIAKTSLKVAALMDDDIAKGTDGNFYYMNNEANRTPYSRVGVNDESYAIYKLLLSSDEVKRVITTNICILFTFFLIDSLHSIYCIICFNIYLFLIINIIIKIYYITSIIRCIILYSS